MSHVTHMNESCHTYEWVMSHVWMSHGTHINVSYFSCEHIWMSHVTILRSHTSHVNESCLMISSQLWYIYKYMYLCIQSRLLVLCNCVVFSHCELNFEMVEDNSADFWEFRHSDKFREFKDKDYVADQCAAVCCSVLQCVAMSYRVLQSVAMCCGVLQCGAVCCSVFRLCRRPFLWILKSLQKTIKPVEQTLYSAVVPINKSLPQTSRANPVVRPNCSSSEICVL